MNVSYPQGSAEWFAARAGKVTASRINDVMASVKKGEAAGRKNYRIQLVTERLTGMVEETYQSADMLWGIEKEPDAREAYQFVTDNIVEQVGFIDHPEIKMSGASPDGLILGGGILEIKCPKSSTHVEWMADDKVPDKHVNQMMWQMACTGSTWGDFVSYDPRMPVHKQLFIKRLDFDEILSKKITDEVIKFIGEVEQLFSKLAA